MDAKVNEWRPGPNVCRCCLTEGCYKDISTEYFWMGKREVYAEMLSETFDLTIAYSKSGGPNSNSRLICENCIARLRDATDFKRQVKECEKTFVQHLDPGNNVPADIELRLEPQDDKTVKLESVKLEKRHSDDDFDDRNDFATTLDDDDDDLDDEPLLKLASKTPKKETENVDILDLLDNAKVTEKRKSSTRSKEPPTKKLKKKEPLPKPSASKNLTTEKKKKGYIEESDSSIVLKNEDGTETKLTLLKRPIPLASLEYENVNKEANSNKTKVVALRQNTNATISKIQKCLRKEERPEPHGDTKTTNVGFLKDPISLEHLRSNKGFVDSEGVTSITFNAKIVQGVYASGRQRRRIVDVECQIWKQNALTIFKYSLVYPFLYVKNKYKCYVCSRCFLESSALKHHTLREHDTDELEQELNNRPRDKYLKVDVSSLDCKICLYIAPDLQSLKAHLKSHGKNVDPDMKDNIVPFKLGGSTHDCQYCDETFAKLRLLVIHMSKHFNNYSCEICGAVSISLDLLKRHLKIHETGTFPCGMCDKIFNNAAKRSIHIRGVHLKQFPRRCPICPARFNSNFQRTKHLRIVHNQTSGLFRCETCGREYDLKYHLLIHIRSVHLQERNNECPTCHARFFSKYSLSRHMIIHTGEKNFKCEICGKTYARSKNLREHARTHTVGQNSCAVCGQSFLDHTALINHMNVVHGVCDYKHVF